MENSIHAPHKGNRSRLLATVCAAALTAAVCTGGTASASDADTDRPVLWLDLGWHFERYSGNGDVFAPPFALAQPRPDFETISPLSAQTTKAYSYGADGKISFQPEGSDWIVSAAFRYGRAHGRRHVHEQTLVSFHYTYRSKIYQKTGKQFDDVIASNSEAHVIVDFEAGKDVGLGMFGGTSTISAGIRFAQFNSTSISKLKADPDFQIIPKYFQTVHRSIWMTYHHHTFDGSFQADRSFRGIGPSLKWAASAPLMGEADNGQVSIDWGINGAILFGKQKAQVSHRTNGYYYYTHRFFPRVLTQTHYNAGADHSRHKIVVVPNLGGFAGLSFRYSDAKLSLGYRADYFFGAVDGGIDTRHKATRGFYGPFASISVGLGD